MPGISGTLSTEYPILTLTQMYTPDGGDFYYNGKTSYEFICKDILQM